jgi:hypothetical protein
MESKTQGLASKFPCPGISLNGLKKHPQAKEKALSVGQERRKRKDKDKQCA